MTCIDHFDKIGQPAFFCRSEAWNQCIYKCHRNESKLFYQKLHSWHFSLTFLDKVGHVYFSPKNHVHTILFSKILLLCEVEDQLASKQKKKINSRLQIHPKHPKSTFWSPCAVRSCHTILFEGSKQGVITSWCRAQQASAWLQRRVRPQSFFSINVFQREWARQFCHFKLMTPGSRNLTNDNQIRVRILLII